MSTLRIGSVSYLNAKPLIWGLERASGIQLLLDVPARLLDGLRAGRFDVALLPVIDYQRMEGLRIIPASGIGCDGPTLTVRIFSRSPLEQIQTLACDTESHTSVALARIILAERYGIRPEFTTLPPGGRGSARAGCEAEERLGRSLALPGSAGASPSPAMLLIGDKVVCQEPAGMPHQLDLGAAWRELTGLPFVFAVWMARADVDLADLPQRLSLAKTQGLGHVDEIIARDAIPRGWPADIARQYLTRYLKYDIGPRQLEAIRLFHELAAKHRLLPAGARPLVIEPNPPSRPGFDH